MSSCGITFFARVLDMVLALRSKAGKASASNIHTSDMSQEPIARLGFRV